MSITLCPNIEIEMIDLTGDPVPKTPQTRSQTHNKTDHFDVQLYVLNYQQSLKNKTTIWHRDTDGSFYAVEQLNPSLYHQQRQPYLDRDGQVDVQLANQKWQQWSGRDFHPALEAFVEYNDPSPGILVLKDLEQTLSRGDTALQNIWAEVACADKVLEITAMAPKSRVSDGTPAAIKDILIDVAGHLRSAEKAQQESKNQLESLSLAVRALISSNSISAKATIKRQIEDEKMIDTINFLKECLENHARLVDIILGRPEPLIQQGTDLMQAMLSEMFGLPAPTLPEIVQEVVEDSMEESGIEFELDQDFESESELTEFSEEETAPCDFMDIEADESSRSDSDAYHEDSASEHSEYSPEATDKSEGIVRKKKHEKAKRAREALYTRFGLTVEEPGETEDDQDDMQEEESRGTKHQKKIQDQPQVLKQTTLTFDKVRKNRRLFSRKELQEAGQGTNHAEEPENTFPSMTRRTSNKQFRVPAGYKY